MRLKEIVCLTTNKTTHHEVPISTITQRKVKFCRDQLMVSLTNQGPGTNSSVLDGAEGSVHSFQLLFSFHGHDNFYFRNSSLKIVDGWKWGRPFPAVGHLTTKEKKI